jgi:hypothetical protein
MTNIIDMTDQSDWVVMNMVKAHIKNLKASNLKGENNDDIIRNENALRSFFEDIKERSATAALAA